MPLDTTSVRQRAWLGGAAQRCLLWSLPLWCGSWWRRLVELPYEGTATRSNFDQYDYVARALLDGRVVSLDVPDALRERGTDPYDVATGSFVCCRWRKPVY